MKKLPPVAVLRRIRLKIIPIMLLFYSICGTAQSICPAHAHRFQAEQIYRSGKHLKKAVRLYKKAFRQQLKDVPSVFYALECANSVGDRKSARLFLEHGISLGLTPADYQRNWEFCGKGRPLDTSLENTDTLLLMRRYRSRLNDSLIRKLAELEIRDQMFRRAESSDSIGYELLRNADSLNWADLKAITLAQGRLPVYAEIGLQGNDNLTTLFYHMDKAVLEWFLPYILAGIQQDKSSLGRVILYQLERIGQSEGLIFTVTDDLKITTLGPRTRMANNMWCQSFGEWFDEMQLEEQQSYFTPLDPRLPRAEINRVRQLFCLDSIESCWKRKTWVKVVPIGVFEEKFNF